MRKSIGILPDTIVTFNSKKNTTSKLDEKSCEISVGKFLMKIYFDTQDAQNKNLVVFNQKF